MLEQTMKEVRGQTVGELMEGNAFTKWLTEGTSKGGGAVTFGLRKIVKPPASQMAAFGIPAILRKALERYEERLGPFRMTSRICDSTFTETHTLYTRNDRSISMTLNTEDVHQLPPGTAERMVTSFFVEHLKRRMKEGGK